MRIHTQSIISLLIIQLVGQGLAGDTAPYGIIPKEERTRSEAVADALTPYFYARTNEWRSGMRIEPPFSDIACSSVPFSPKSGFWRLTPSYSRKLLRVGHRTLGEIGFLPLKARGALQTEKYPWIHPIDIMTNGEEVVTMIYYETNIYARILIGVSCHELACSLGTRDSQKVFSVFRIVPELTQEELTIGGQLENYPDHLIWRGLESVLSEEGNSDEIRSVAALLAIERNEQRILPHLRRLARDTTVRPLLRCSVFAALAKLGNHDDLAFIEQWSKTAPLFYSDTIQ